MSKAPVAVFAVSFGLLATVVAATPDSAQHAEVAAAEASVEEVMILDTRFAAATDTVPDADHDDDHGAAPGADDGATARGGVAPLGRYGTTYPRDSDGRVPEYYGRYTGCSDGIIGRSSYVRSGGVTKWTTRYDTCEMRRFGAGKNDWARLKTHERAHTRGWGHWERPQSSNPAYNPRIRICRC